MSFRLMRKRFIDSLAGKGLISKSGDTYKVDKPDVDEVAKLWAEFKKSDPRRVVYNEHELHDEIVTWVEDFSGKTLEPMVWEKTGRPLTNAETQSVLEDLMSKMDRDKDDFMPPKTPADIFEEKYPK